MWTDFSLCVLLSVDPFSKQMHFSCEAHRLWEVLSFVVVTFLSSEEIVRKLSLILDGVSGGARSEYMEWKEQNKTKKGAKTT